MLHSSISLPTKLRLYNAYVLPVLLYDSDTWNVTEAMKQHLTAFVQWCSRHILRVPYTARLSNMSVHSQTNQPPVSSIIKQRRLKLFGNTVWAAPTEDHMRALDRWRYLNLKRRLMDKEVFPSLVRHCGTRCRSLFMTHLWQWCSSAHIWRLFCFAEHIVLSIAPSWQFRL